MTKASFQDCGNPENRVISQEKEKGLSFPATTAVLPNPGMSGPSQTSYDLVNMPVPHECCGADSHDHACARLLIRNLTLSKCLADARFILGHSSSSLIAVSFLNVLPFHSAWKPGSRDGATHLQSESLLS